jgi:hypothetical protein
MSTTKKIARFKPPASTRTRRTVRPALATDVPAIRSTMSLAAREVSRVPLAEAFDVGTSGVYMIFLCGRSEPGPVTPPMALHGWLRTGRWPVYVGCAWNLAERGTWHKETVSHIEGLDAAKVWVATLELPGAFDFALFVERMLCEQLRPAWNRSLRGFGGHRFGSQRKGQSTSPFDSIFAPRPERAWVRPPSPWEEMRAVFSLLGHVLSEHGAIAPWPALWTPAGPR